MMKIYEEDFDSLALAGQYLDATAGRFLSGLIHNANNSCHIIALAAELLRGGMAQNSSTKLDKILNAESDLQVIFNTASSRSRLLECTPEEIQTEEVVRSELDFFQNCLFFKHNLQTTVTKPPVLKPLRLPPLPLVFCLEAGLLNTVEACRETEHTGPFALDIDIAAVGEGVRIAITSPTQLPKGIDPFTAGASTRSDHLGLGLSIARDLCTRLGWSVTLVGDETSCTYTLTIPRRESDFTTS